MISKRPKTLTGGSGLVRGTYSCGGKLKAKGGKISTKKSTKRKKCC